MSNLIKKSIVACISLAACTAFSQTSISDSVDHLKSIMEATRTGNTSHLSPQEQEAISAGIQSGQAAAQIKATPAQINSVINQSAAFEQMAREAYVSALPPRDRARAQSILLNDYSTPGTGALYYFVSRSMPLSVLKAYAVEALYTGGSLVVKGIRKGDTLKEYISEVVSEFNQADGQTLAGIEINPNLFDMFGVTVVPTIVWTNRTGLDDMGSGCQRPDEGTQPLVEFEDPAGQAVFVEKPVCNLLPENAYYKISGIVNTNYALDRFEAAGADKVSINQIRADLGQYRSNVNQGTAQEIGSTLTPIDGPLRIDAMPEHVLLDWEESLKTRNVKRTGWGPAFSSEGTDDAEYRKELLAIIRKGLGR